MIEINVRMPNLYFYDRTSLLTTYCCARSASTINELRHSTHNWHREKLHHEDRLLSPLFPSLRVPPRNEVGLGRSPPLWPSFTAPTALLGPRCGSRAQRHSPSLWAPSIALTAALCRRCGTRAHASTNYPAAESLKERINRQSNSDREITEKVGGSEASMS